MLRECKVYKNLCLLFELFHLFNFLVPDITPVVLMGIQNTYKGSGHSLEMQCPCSITLSCLMFFCLLYTERKKKRRVNFIPKFHSSLKKFVRYFTMITKRYMYGTKVPNFIGL